MHSIPSIKTTNKNQKEQELVAFVVYGVTRNGIVEKRRDKHNKEHSIVNKKQDQLFKKKLKVVIILIKYGKAR